MAEPILSKEQAEKILAKNNTNAVRRVIEKSLKNQPLTAKEQKLVKQLAAGQDPSPNPLPGGEGEWVSSYEALGKLVGLHRASFPRIVKAHRDAPRARANGDHNVAAWKQFLAQHPEIDCRSGQAPAGSAKEELEREKLRAIKRENDAAEGLLVAKASVIDSNRRVAAGLKNLLRKLLNEMPGAVAGKDIPQAREYGGRLYDDLMREIAAWEKEWPS